jgi:hypothetical protein
VSDEYGPIEPTQDITGDLAESWCLKYVASRYPVNLRGPEITVGIYQCDVVVLVRAFEGQA